MMSYMGSHKAEVSDGHSLLVRATQRINLSLANNVLDLAKNAGDPFCSGLDSGSGVISQSLRGSSELFQQVNGSYTDGQRPGEDDWV